MPNIRGFTLECRIWLLVAVLLPAGFLAHLEGEAGAHGQHRQRQRGGGELRAKPGQRRRVRQAQACETMKYTVTPDYSVEPSVKWFVGWHGA
jgi:hypothetical protein